MIVSSYSYESFKVLNTSETLDISLFNNAKLDVVGMSQIGKDSLLFAYRNKVEQVLSIFLAAYFIHLF